MTDVKLHACFTGQKLQVGHTSIFKRFADLFLVLHQTVVLKTNQTIAQQPNSTLHGHVYPIKQTHNALCKNSLQEQDCHLLDLLRFSVLLEGGSISNGTLLICL